MCTNNHNGDNPVIEMNDALRAKFMNGGGVVCLQSSMTDTDLLDTIKYVASFGKPFVVIPAEPFVYIDGKADAKIGVWVPCSGKSSTLLPHDNDI